MTGRQTPFENRTMGATARLKGHRIVKAYLDRQGCAGEAARRQIHLVSYPRSGNTLMRRYLSILQGRAQQSAYADDVIDAATVALTRELDGFDIVKSHQLPDDEKDVIYILRDGRNATLSFLYMNFLAGGHSFSRPNQTWDAIRQLDEQEGSWSEHVGKILRQRRERRIIFLRYEDLIANPQAEISRVASFLGRALSEETIARCLEMERDLESYADNPLNGYLYEPAPGTIYDLLKRHRTGDYWRHIFDERCRRHFHEHGGSEALMHFGYERSSDWWQT